MNVRCASLVARAGHCVSSSRRWDERTPRGQAVGQAGTTISNTRAPSGCGCEYGEAALRTSKL